MNSEYPVRIDKMSRKKIFFQSSYTTEYTLTIRSNDCDPCYLPKGVENSVNTKNCTWMFIAALFITVNCFVQTGNN